MSVAESFSLREPFGPKASLPVAFPSLRSPAYLSPAPPTGQTRFGMAPRPLTSRPPTLGDRIDQATSLAELDVLMSEAGRERDSAIGHERGDEILCRALVVATEGRQTQAIVRRLLHKWRKMDRPYVKL